MPGEQLHHGLPDPGRAVDAVRDREDPAVDAAPRGIGGGGVELADRIRAVRQSEAERRHVELLAVSVRAEPEVQHLLHRDAARVEKRAGDAADEIGVEPLVAGRDRRVDREDRVPLDIGPCVVEAPALGDVFAGAFSEQERRVTLVEVPDRRGEPERPQGSYSADPEHELLVEPHLSAAHVEDVGDRAVLVGVVDDVRVEQQHGDAPDLHQPHRDRQAPTGKPQLDGER